ATPALKDMVLVRNSRLSVQAVSPREWSIVCKLGGLAKSPVSSDCHLGQLEGRKMQINYMAVVIAAIAGFLVGWGWYTVFGKVWLEALGKKKQKDCKPTPMPFIIAGVSCLLIAWMLAGLMGHLSDITVRGGIISALF